VQQPLLAGGVAIGQIGPDESVFAAEGAVEGGLGHAGPLDHAVDADGVDALLVEQLVGCGQQPVAGRRSEWGRGRHSLDITDRSVYRQRIRQTCLF